MASSPKYQSMLSDSDLQLVLAHDQKNLVQQQ